MEEFGSFYSSAVGELEHHKLLVVSAWLELVTQGTQMHQVKTQMYTYKNVTRSLSSTGLLCHGFRQSHVLALLMVLF